MVATREPQARRELSTGPAGLAAKALASWPRCPLRCLRAFSPGPNSRWRNSHVICSVDPAHYWCPRRGFTIGASGLAIAQFGMSGPGSQLGMPQYMRAELKPSLSSAPMKGVYVAKGTFKLHLGKPNAPRAQTALGKDAHGGKKWLVDPLPTAGKLALVPFAAGLLCAPPHLAPQLRQTTLRRRKRATALAPCHACCARGAALQGARTKRIRD
jgi:hypothetical protein